MYENRRRRTMDPGHFINEQLAEWRWNSHLWVDKRILGSPNNYAHGYTECAWCGWRPPTEMPLDHATLCPDNPAVKSHLSSMVDKG